MIPRLTETVTWIKVDRPTFDLVGVVLNALGLAGICAAVAFVLGIVLGVVFIRRSRRRPDWATPLTLHLAEGDRPLA